MKLVSIQSPYKGNTEQNIAYARRALHNSILRGEAPFASHLLYTQVLRDDDPDERERALKCDHAFLVKCGLVAVYCDLGITEGMELAISKASELNILIEIRYIGVQQLP